MSELLPQDRFNAPPASGPQPMVAVRNEPPVPKPSIAVWRVVLAGLVAVGADSVGAIPGEAMPLVFDIAVGVVLTLILGPRVALLGALVLEAIPGLGVLPSWVAAVAWVAFAQGGRKP